ncbi:MAG: TolC family protein [Ginsengibacter sp.]
MKKIKIFPALLFLFISISAFSQSNSLTLDSCYSLARKNYPLIKQYSLIEKTNEYTVANIAKGFLPRINFTGQATYQSDVTQFPKAIPGAPVLTKDQYRLFAEVNQPVYDGGVIREQKKLQEANSEVDKQKLEVELYKLKDRVNQLFFGVLLMQARLKQNQLLQSDVRHGLEKINAAIANGTALKSSADVLEAELLKTDEQADELASNKNAFIRMLALFIGRTIDSNTEFITPAELNPGTEIKRPELQLFDSQDKIFNAQKSLLTAQNRPKLSVFLQAGYGKPALNILSNSFDPFYIGGVRLTFPISGFYTIKNEKKLIELNRQNIDVQKQTFLFNTNVVLQQQNEDITRLQKIINTDDKIIPLREHIKQTALAQLNLGVATSRDYLREVNAENSARQDKILHSIQLLMAEYNKQNTTGE